MCSTRGIPPRVHLPTRLRAPHRPCTLYPHRLIYGQLLDVRRWDESTSWPRVSLPPLHALGDPPALGCLNPLLSVHPQGLPLCDAQVGRGLVPIEAAEGDRGDAWKAAHLR